MKRFNFPDWFWLGLGIWLLIGLPAYVGGALYKGSPIPDLPPFMFAEYSLAANVPYFLFAGIILLPVFLVAALAISRLRNRKN